MRKLNVLFVSLAAFALVACSKPEPKVARGEALTTGNAQYDDFFRAVVDLRSAAMEADSDEKTAHGLLTKALGLEDTTEASAAVKTADERAKKMKEQGVLLHLEVEPDAKLVSEKKAQTSVDAAGLGLMKGVEESAKAELALEKKLAGISSKAQELEKSRVDLRAGAPTAFKDDKQAKRDEIISELDAAADVLANAGQLGGQTAGRASRFVIELAAAVETGASVAPVAPPGSKEAVASAKKTFVGKKPQAFASSAPKTGGSPPAAPKPPPAAKPAKKGKGGDDFEP